MCQNFNGVVIADTGEKILIARLRCKSWYCDECAVLNQKRWRAALFDYVNKNLDAQWCFFTLTAHEKAMDGQYSLKNIARAWDRLSKRLHRKFGKFEYCRVYEKHKSGRYHLHAIATFQFGDIVRRNLDTAQEYTDSPYLRDTARSLGMGYMTSADDLRVPIASVGYVTKYMTKQFSVDREAWGRVRRIQTSRGIKYNSIKAETGLSWEMHDLVTQIDFFQFANQAKAVILLSDGGEELTSDFFLDNSHYPP